MAILTTALVVVTVELLGLVFVMGYQTLAGQKRIRRDRERVYAAWRKM